MGTIANILGGLYTVYHDAYGEALPELDDLEPPAVTIATPGGSWANVGFTDGDQDIQYEGEWEEDKVNEHNGPVALYLIGESAKVMVALKEDDMTAWDLGIAAATLTAVSAGANQTAQDVLTIGDGSAAYKSLLLLGTSPEAGSRVIHVPKCQVTGSFEIKATKGQRAGKGLEFTVVTDTTLAAGARLMSIYDITAVASS